MRLSSRLSDRNKNNGEIESFIDWDKYTTEREYESNNIRFISDGDIIDIQIGTIMLPFYSTTCEDSVSFISPKKLHCLIVNKNMVSIDCQLQCMDYDKRNPKCRECVNCGKEDPKFKDTIPCVQAWFLIGADDIYSTYPTVNIIRQHFRLPKNIKLPIEAENKITKLLGKAEIAYRETLGAGAIIYLRSVFEQITREVGNKAGVDIYKQNGKLKPFSQVLKAVDTKCSIIPIIYSDNGYALFCKLSNIVHGNADEETALKEYEPLRRLVIGIIENVKKKEEEIKNNVEIQKALREIGFLNGGADDE